MTNPTMTIAGITNVGLCARAIERAVNRADHLPGMTVFYGHSGMGKSQAASYTANRYRAYYVECKSTWTRKAFLLAILKEMGIEPTRTLYEMTDQIAEELVLSQRLLIIDETDHLVDKNAVEVIRDIYEGSQAPILLIGEERLPAKLKRWERFHGRILEFVPAQPPTLDDVSQLIPIYGRGIDIAHDLREAILDASRGSVRRVCVNLDRIRQHCLAKGLQHIAKADWGYDFFTGEAPRRHVA